MSDQSFHTVHLRAWLDRLRDSSDPRLLPGTRIRDKVWQRLVVEETGLLPQPGFAAVDGDRVVACDAPWLVHMPAVDCRPVAADLGDALLACPGSYILKPRYGSNGVAVVRLVSHPDGSLTAESDCPDTAPYLDEFPCDPRLHGRDLVAAAATHRSRFVDRATAGLPEWAINQSILEEEIRPDRADGSVFEPRVVAQRVRVGSGESFVTLGAICKRVDTSVGASVARGFREETLDVSLRRFLRERVPPADLTERVRRTRDEILAVGDRLREAITPLVEARGARVHQFGIDCRLCWNTEADRAEFPFLEIQFGIGRIDWGELGTPALAGYQTPEQLRLRFGPEAG